MGKSLNGWTVRHLLALSVALNVGMFLRLAYYNSESSESDRISEAHCMPAERRQEGGFGGSAVLSTSSSSSAIGWSGKAQSSAKNGSHVSVGEVEDDGRIVNFDHGDPTMYEKFWKQASEKSSIVISGWQSISYFSDQKNLCWFLEPKLAKEIVRLHEVVGNAVTKGKHIVVGTGSTQLFQAALYALSSTYEETGPVSVVSATPYYSFYKQVINYLKSGLYKWAGDASKFNEDGPYIELVTSPNNPDGFLRQPVINGSKGMLLHDFAYYWPQYTPITDPADHDLMLFTVSKSTGHAGLRIGWALVNDEEVAKRMIKFIELSSIGVSKDSQLRAAKILQVVSDSCESEKGDNFFNVSFHLVTERWEQLREAVNKSGAFSLPEFPSSFCKYSKRHFRTQPAFAWLKCEGEIEDCEGFLRDQKILTRSGKHFGMSSKYARISMLDRDANFNLFIKRLSRIHS